MRAELYWMGIGRKEEMKVRGEDKQGVASSRRGSPLPVEGTISAAFRL